MFWKKTEIAKVIKEYGEVRANLFLTLLHTIASKSLELMKSGQDGGTSEMMKVAIENIRAEYGEALLHQYSDFMEKNLTNVRLLKELSDNSMKYTDLSVLQEKKQEHFPNKEPKMQQYRPEPRTQSSTEGRVQQEPTVTSISPEPKSALGRDEAKHIRCGYVGHETDCPRNCDKCAIAIKTDADEALARNDLDAAIRLYKKAVFLEPKFAEAWCNLGSAYGKKLEYNNSLSAFDKAIAIDYRFGKALFGKALALKNLDRISEALSVAQQVLEFYDDEEVSEFVETLILLEPDHIYSLDEAIDIMTNEAYDVLERSNLVGVDGSISTERSIECKEEFAQFIFNYCRKRYGSLGDDKVWSESILGAFYGSICATMLYYNDRQGFENKTPYEYVADHINLEELERKAEKLLGIQSEDAQSEHLWNVIYGFVKFSKVIVGRVLPASDRPAAIIDATESAYMMGMLCAMRHCEADARESQRSALDEALARLADSIKDYNYTPPARSAMCYSISIPDEVLISIKCGVCGKPATLLVFENETDLLQKYNALAQEFSALGFEAKVVTVCDDCADSYHPSTSRYQKNSIVFSLVRPDSGQVVNSYPNTRSYNDFPYRIVLAFLRGADTLAKLSQATDTELKAETYLEHIYNVLGDVSGDLET